MDYVLWGAFCVSCGVLVWNCLTVWSAWPWAASVPLGVVLGVSVFVSFGPLRGRVRSLLVRLRPGKRR